ncbi:Zinc finger and BTB domain-containing protein 17, partial [Stegodyphus mimosarum]
MNIPSTNSSSVDNSSMICSLSDSLNDRYCVTKTDEAVLNDNFNHVQGLENSRIPKDFFINSDFMKDKNIQLLLQNVTTTTESSVTDCTSTNTTVTDGKSCKPSELPEDLLGSNVSLKDFNVHYEAVIGRKNDSEKSYVIPQVPDQETLKGNNDKSNAFRCTLTNSNDNTSSKISLKAHLVINNSDSNDFTQSKQFLHDSDNCKLTNVNENSNSELIQSGILANNVSTFQAILPIEKISPILEPSTSEESLTLTTTTTAVIPVSTDQKTRPEKILPVLLPAQEIAGLKKCRVCQMPYLTEEEIIQHFKANHPRCICKECNYMAEHPYVIKRHSYRHNNSGCFCKICGKKYKDHYILKMHIKMVHLPAEVLYSCNICEKKFTRKAHLKRHLRIHEPDKPYKCLYCDYRGCEKSDITKHLLIHDAPKHKCDLCDKSFRHIKNKELHLKRHLKQRDYKCGVCDFYGYTFTDIRKHIERRHTDQKLSTCSDCGQAYKNLEQLKEHKKNGQCHTYLLAQELTKGDESISTEVSKETALLEEIPLGIISDSEPPKNSSSTISECSEETLNVLQNGQFVLSSVDGIFNAQQGQIVLSGVEENNVVSSENLSYISVDKDSNKLITLVTTDGRSISLPLKNCSLPLECLATSEKTNSIEVLTMPGMKIEDSPS